MNQYRKLDDTINMRLNRATAQYRDRERSGAAGRGDVEEQACAHVWRELVGAPPKPLSFCARALIRTPLTGEKPTGRADKTLWTTV